MEATLTYKDIIKTSYKNLRYFIQKQIIINSLTFVALSSHLLSFKIENVNKMYLSSSTLWTDSFKSPALHIDHL